MTSLITVVAGSAEVPITVANSVQNDDDQLGNVRIAKAIVIDLHSAFSKGSPYPHHTNTPPPRHLLIPPVRQDGVASVSTTTWGTRR